MATTYYYSVMGQIVGESTSGVRTDYLTDALGSVVATVDNTAAVVNTYRYKPYGDQLSKTGSGADPKFLWVGSWGYRKTGKAWAETYVRARHYGTRQAAWTTVDPLWPNEPAHIYCRGTSPALCKDPSGRKVVFGQGCPTEFANCCDRMTGLDKSKLSNCLAGLNLPVSWLDDFLRKLSSTCGNEASSNKMCVVCAQQLNSQPPELDSCCPVDCSAGHYGETLISSSGGSSALGPSCKTDPGCKTAKVGSDGRQCDGMIAMCPGNFAYSPTQQCWTILHEMAHSILNVCHKKNTWPYKDVIVGLQCCMCRAETPVADWQRQCHAFCLGFGK